MNEWAVGGLWPDLVVLLDAPAAVLAQRMRDRDLDRFERAGEGFHARVRTGFAEMAAADPDRWIVVGATDDPTVVAASIRAAITTRTGW